MFRFTEPINTNYNYSHDVKRIETFLHKIDSKFAH